LGSCYRLPQLRRIMEEAIFDYIESHWDELVTEFQKTYTPEQLANMDDYFDEELFYQFAEPIAVEALNYHDDDEDYDRWKEMQDAENN